MATTQMNAPQTQTYQAPAIGEGQQYQYATQTQSTTSAQPQPQQGYPVSSQPVTQNAAPQYYAQPRNACIQCGELYPLPNGASSWRCRKCGKFNDLQPGCCVVL
mmetsp:Transcript_7672/g.11895  ORF Transcript_7672/g.11895 Transcript_7672/m.11895 type:complete len:104 (-) Transcript_7672:321-632(-)